MWRGVTPSSRFPNRVAKVAAGMVPRMASPSAPRLLALHGLRLKGFAEAAAVAACVDLEPSVAEAQLGVLADEGLVTYREGRMSGWALTATGRKEHERLLAEELDVAACRAVVDDSYRRFVALNTELLELCTDWQLRTVDGRQVVNDHTDSAHDQAVVNRLIALHDRVRPITAALRDALTRFSGYGPRLRSALERVAAGEHEWLAKPLIDSYHTVWFELHEDLLATLGIERAKEGET